MCSLWERRSADRTVCPPQLHCWRATGQIQPPLFNEDSGTIVIYGYSSSQRMHKFAGLCGYSSSQRTQKSAVQWQKTFAHVIVFLQTWRIHPPSKQLHSSFTEECVQSVHSLQRIASERTKDICPACMREITHVVLSIAHQWWVTLRLWTRVRVARRAGCS